MYDPIESKNIFLIQLKCSSRYARIFISLQFSVKFPRSHVSESSSSSGSRCGFLRFVGNKKWSRWSNQFYVYVDIVVDVELDVNVDVVSQRMFENSHLFQGCVGVTAILNRGGITLVKPTSLSWRKNTNFFYLLLKH